MAGLILGIIGTVIAIGSLIGSIWIAKVANNKADESNKIAEGSKKIAERALKVAENALAFQKESEAEGKRIEVSGTIEPKLDDKVPAILLTATNVGSQRVFLKRVVFEANGVEISQDSHFIQPDFKEGYIDPHQPSEQKAVAWKLKPAIIEQTGKKRGTVTVTGYFVDGEGNRWPREPLTGVSFDLTKEYPRGFHVY